MDDSFRGAKVQKRGMMPMSGFYPLTQSLKKRSQERVSTVDAQKALWTLKMTQRIPVDALGQA